MELLRVKSNMPYLPDPKVYELWIKLKVRVGQS